MTRAVLVLLSVFIISTCGLIYELIAGALASYLLGDSITQFSTVIGTYLFAMGIGSYLSKHIDKRVIETFIVVEILIALVGGFSAMLLFVSFEYVAYFRVILYGVVTLTGVFVGVEIPLLMRIVQDKYSFKDLVSNIFTFDYIGALMASLLFPLLLVPHFGLIRTALLFGILNAGVAILAVYVFRAQISKGRAFLFQGALISLALLVTGMALAGHIESVLEGLQHENKVIYKTVSPYQKIVLTRNRGDLRLFLNGNLQFSSRDEYRYHESLVHVGLSRLPFAKHVLILGGGDGLAVREVLKYPQIESITLVDLDPVMTGLFSQNLLLTALNENALVNSKVRVVNDDAFLWMRANQQTFDFIAIDFPDPSNFSIGKLYTTKFYQHVERALSPDGLVVVQSTSPYVARKSFWCIAHTLEASGFHTFPYHVYVPAFGAWGFVLASKRDTLSQPLAMPSNLRFLSSSLVSALFSFPVDLGEVETKVNRLQEQILVRYFEDEWS